jgi:cytochrome c oxidase subunit IV
VDVRGADGLSDEHSALTAGIAEATHSMNTAEKHTGGLTTDIIVYLLLLGISGLQVALAYSYAKGGEGLAIRMLIVAFVEAAIAVLFFMHLRWENRAMIISIAVVSLFVLAMMQDSWTDSFRILHGAPFSHFR